MSLNLQTKSKTLLDPLWLLTTLGDGVLGVANLLS